MASTSILLIAFLLAYLVYIYAIYPVFISPLAKVPNAHWSSSFSSLWILWKRYKEHEVRAIHTAHLKHGELVRLGPNEVSVACVDNGIKTVYGGGFEKSTWYSNLFTNYGTPNMFTMVENKAHSLRKRMISHIYSKSYVQSSSELHTISQLMIFGRLLPLLDKASKDGRALDVFEINFSAAIEFILAFIFGIQHATNFVQDEVARRDFYPVYKHSRPQRFWYGELPGIVSFLAKLGIHTAPKEQKAANAEIEKWTLSKCEAAKISMTEKPSPLEPSYTETYPIVYGQMSTSLQASELKSPSQDLHTASEILDHIIAGNETSGIALTYLMYELSIHPQIQEQLHSELLTLSPSLSWEPSTQLSQEKKPPADTAEAPPLPSPRSIDALPLLDATIMETLRLHAPIPGPQPRTTPSNPTSIANSPPLPPGVRISSQAYTLHRNPEVFPLPETWDPYRWLHASGLQKAEMHRWFWAFGSGGRMCVGSHFALQEMKLVVAGVYANFRTGVVDGGKLEQRNEYVGMPRDKRLMLRFWRV